MRVWLGLGLAIGLPLMCSTPSLAQTRDVCALLDRNEGWEEALHEASDKWRVSPGVILAVIDQESRFRADAKGQGAVDASSVRNFGFAQANLRTWNWFLKETDRETGSRSNFALSVDFVGWHFATMERRIRAPRTNIVAHYLAYKLGEGGYARGAPDSARAIATTLAARARSNDVQLRTCGFDTERAIPEQMEAKQP